MITLFGNPMSTGSIYRFHSKGGYITKKGRELKESYQLLARQQWREEPLQGDLGVKIWLWFGDKRRRDFDNFHKLSIDALNGIVWEDDSQIKEAVILLCYDKENPRIEIEVTKL